MDRSARWIRVSSGGQSEETQLSEVIDPYIGRQGYEDSKILYRLHDVSAAKGEHAAMQEQVIQDISDGRYTVLVVADSSRIERRDEGDELFIFLARVHLAGGRVDFVAEPQLGKRDIASKVSTLLSQHGNAEYVRKLQTNITRGMKGIMAGGFFAGSEPWGAVAVGPKRERHLVHTGAAREYGPQILECIDAGMSLGDVARWLTAEGVLSGRGEGKAAKWWPKSVAAVVRSKTLLGEYQCSYTVSWTDEQGKHSETLRWTHRFEATVSHDLWLSANRTLDERGDHWRAGRGRTGRKAVEPLSGASRCHSCQEADVDSPMYRLTSGNLRCTGRGADRKGCGVMLPLDTARALADQAFAAKVGLMYAMYERKRVPGNASQIEVERDRLNQEIALVAQISDRSERRSRTAELEDQLDELDATEVIPDTEQLVPTGEDYATFWARLGADQRRAFLTSGEFRVSFGRADGTEDQELNGWGIWLDHLDETD